MSLEFETYLQYHFENEVKIKSNIKREDIPQYCSAFDIVVRDRMGASFYYPRNPTEKSIICRYEWFIKYNSDIYGIRISHFITVENKEMSELIFHLSWGPRFESKIGTSFDSETMRKIIDEIDSVLNDINTVIYEIPQKEWIITYYLKLPHGFEIEEQINTSHITFFPSFKDKKGHAITCISIQVKAHFENQAKNIGLKTLNKLILILSLLSGNKIENLMTIQFPDEFEPKRVFETSENKNLTINDVYPAKYELFINPLETANDNISFIVLSSDLIFHQSLNEDDKIWRSINAFVAGQEIKSNQPTLSSVAFMTSIATFSESQKCDGIINCSICGDLNNFKHDLISERNSITNIISQTLGIEEDSDEKKKLSNLIRDVYYKQRSAFVHDAILRHSELKDNINLEIVHPTKNKVLNEALEFSEHLNSIHRISRLFLLYKLLPFDNRIQKLIDKTREMSIISQTLSIGNISIGTQPVGFGHGKKH